VLRQYPAEFEYTATFLDLLAQSAQSGLFASFKKNYERERTHMVREAVVNEYITPDDALYASVL
jgi:hypothetical protein